MGNKLSSCLLGHKGSCTRSWTIRQFLSPNITHFWILASHKPAVQAELEPAVTESAGSGTPRIVSVSPAKCFYFHYCKAGWQQETSYLCVEFVVTQIQRCIDWFERFKVDVDLLLFSFFCHNCSTVNNQTIWRYYKGYNAILDHYERLQAITIKN